MARYSRFIFLCDLVERQLAQVDVAIIAGLSTGAHEIKQEGEHVAT